MECRMRSVLSVAIPVIVLLAGCTPLARKPVAVEPEPAPVPRREIRRPYPVDFRNFSPVDTWLAEAGPVIDDAEGNLNPYVLHVIKAYPPPETGIYPYHCDFKLKEYDIYNGVTQDMWYQGRVVAKAYPDGSRCRDCCGLTFEVFVRAMKLRNERAGLPIDDFNGMDFYDLFNLLQFWYIEGQGDSPQRGIVAYGLGQAIDNLEDARPGDFCDFSRSTGSGHSVIFVDWVRDADGKLTGMKYFSSNKSGVGYLTEYFSDSGGKLLREWTRLARVGPISEYRPFDRKTIPRRKAYAP